MAGLNSNMTNDDLSIDDTCQKTLDTTIEMDFETAVNEQDDTENFNVEISKFTHANQDSMSNNDLSNVFVNKNISIHGNKAIVSEDHGDMNVDELNGDSSCISAVSMIGECNDHYDLLRMLPEAGETKLSKEIRQKLRSILKSNKVVICPRNNCGKPCKSVSAFEYHVVRCGIPLKYIKDKKQRDDSQSSTCSSKQKKTPRRRSTRARMNASEQNQNGGNIDDDLSAEEDGQYSSHGWWKYYEEIPVPPEDFPNSDLYSNLSSLTEAFKHRSSMKCPKNCGRSFRKAANAYDHIKKCVKNQSNHRCKLCGKILTTRHGIKYHLITKHRKKEHDSENDEESEFSGTENTPVKQTKAKIVRISKKKKVRYEEPTEKWQQTLYTHDAVQSWRPSLKHWKTVPLSEMSGYIPLIKTSKVFGIEDIKGNGKPKDYQLPLFASTPVNSDGGLCNIIINVGGSVWAMDWVPLPLNEDSDQYLAISCHNNPDETHLLSKRYSEKGLIQIWKFLKLKNGERPIDSAVFSLGILHECGPLWEMRWCPSGVWESTTSGELSRLGMLACACADGKVRIFSVPHPCSLVKDSNTCESSPEKLMYRAIPHLVLSPGSVCRPYRGECGPTWSLAWQPYSDHNKIIASFADGTVAVWNLKTKSRILKSTSSDALTEYLYPISHFQAHNSVIRSLAWCPTDDNYIATGGYDRIIYIWDLRRPYQPVLQLVHALSYSLSWPLHWGLLIYNTEILSRIRGTRVVDYYHGSKSDRTLGHSSVCFLSHNATVWDNDFSHWSNHVASVDAAGVMSINFLPKAFSKRTSRTKTTIFRAFIEPSEDGSSVDEENYKIIFKDFYPLNKMSMEEEKVFCETANVPPSQVPHVAFHKVRWNPNSSCFFWLAAGGKSGLVRVCHANEMTD